MVLPPAFCPRSMNEDAQLSAGPQGALLNHMSWPTLLFTWNEKLPMSKRPRCLTNGKIGAVGTVRIGRKQQIDLVDVDQLGVDRRRLGSARLVVIDDQFDLAAEQSTLGIDIVAPDFDPQQRSLAATRKAAGLRHRHADLDWRLLCQSA